MNFDWFSMIPQPYGGLAAVAVTIVAAAAHGMALLGPTKQTGNDILGFLNALGGNYGNATNLATVIPSASSATPATVVAANPAGIGSINNQFPH